MTNLKKEISKILVKWGMPTRQVAISEIAALLKEPNWKNYPETDIAVVNPQEDKEIIVVCRNCNATFVEWLSNSNECPECEGQVMFLDKLSTPAEHQCSFATCRNGCLKQENTPAEQTWSVQKIQLWEEFMNLKYDKKFKGADDEAEWWMNKIKLSNSQLREKIKEKVENEAKEWLARLANIKSYDTSTRMTEIVEFRELVLSIISNSGEVNDKK